MPGVSPRSFPAPLLVVTMLALLGASIAPSAAAAATRTVCSEGCDFTQIQIAIDASEDGDTVAVGEGTWTENLVIDRSIQIAGAGRDATFIVPSISEPAPCPTSSLCDGMASTVALVRADDVSISALTIDGDNPALESGIVRGDADLDARNGIVTDYLSGSYTGLVVHDVTVRNVYLRGIYAAYATFDFQRNVVENVQGDGYSIGMFAFAGSGVFAENQVSYANDAISANHSAGIRYLNNVVTRSGSGVHTDNAGDGGGVEDLIEGNTVSDCMDGGYGVWTFVPYLGPLVKQNTVQRCAVGLAAFGGATPSPSRFEANRVVGDGTADSVGILVTSDQLGYGCGDVYATFTSGSVTKTGTGVLLEQPGCALSASITGYDIFRNGIGLENTTSSPVTATGNWWGCPRGPGGLLCDTVVDSGTGVTTWQPARRVPATVPPLPVSARVSGRQVPATVPPLPVSARVPARRVVPPAR